MGIFLPFLCLFLLDFQAMAQPSLAAFVSYFDGINAIYSFGDSLADTGNLIREYNSSIFPCNRLPYGETTFEKPTGRCSNGLLIIDYIALALHLPLLEPYLDRGGNFTHGVNFAVSGATALDTSFLEKRGINPLGPDTFLSIQIKWFREYLNSICSSTIECKHSLANALFLLGEIGGNDYNYALAEGKPLQEIMGLVPYVVKSIMDATNELIDAGALRVVIPGNFPIGCLPIFLTAFRTTNQDAYDEHGCLKSLNRLAILHNVALIKAIKTLRLTYKHILFVYADYYKTFIYFLRNPTRLGLDKNLLLKACCGEGGIYNFNISRICGTPGVPVCQNPAKQINWDGIHLTQEAYKIIAQKLISGTCTVQKI